MAFSLSRCCAPTPVGTVLRAWERPSVDAAGEGLYRTVHRDSVEDVIHDLQEQRISAVVVSVARCGEADTGRVARLIREFPRVPAFALLTQLDQDTPNTVLSLGHSGVRKLIDVRQPAGWRELREMLIADRASDIGRHALGQLALDLIGSPADCWRFFESLFWVWPGPATVQLLAVELGVIPSTLMSRFFRMRLPAPKRYLAMARLTRAARIFENPGISVANVANHLEYSSPQSFSRHVRTILDMTATDFRQRYDGEAMVHRFREDLVLPFLPTLRTFSPLGQTPRRLAVAEPQSQTSFNLSSEPAFDP